MGGPAPAPFVGLSNTLCSFAAPSHFWGIVRVGASLIPPSPGTPERFVPMAGLAPGPWLPGAGGLAVFPGLCMDVCGMGSRYAQGGTIG